MDNGLGRQLKNLIPVLATICASVFVAVVVIGWLALKTGRRVWFFTNDPFVIGNLPFYAGVLSNLGILIWCASATICFLAAYLLKGRPHSLSLFFFSSGILTSLLLCDDLFQMHRIFYPRFMDMSIIVVYSTYGAISLGFVVRFFKSILKTEYLLLALALFFFVAAVATDMLSFLPRGNTAFSDAFKFAGIATWFAYFARTSIRELRRAVARSA